MYFKHTFQFLFFPVFVILFSCTTNEPTIIQLPDTTAPSGYIVSPLNGSSVSGNTSLQVIAIDNEEVDTVYFMIKSQSDTKYRNVDYLTWGPNVGVILVRNTSWSLNFFRNVWNKKKYLNHYWPDNAAVMDEIGFKAEISNLTDNKPNKSTLNKIQFLSGIWNSMPNKNFNDPKNNEISNYYFNPVIIHLAGIRRRDRVEFIKKYKNLFI